MYLNTLALLALLSAPGLASEPVPAPLTGSILSAAGRQMALTRAFVYLEGSYARYMLSEDVVNETVGIEPGGWAPPLSGPGLGVSVREEALERLSVSRRSYGL